jgi:transcriptional regulator with XRE-family HTH domain
MMSGRERLRGWIDRSKYTQRQAAEILGIGEVYLSQILAGIRTPGLDTAVRVEALSGVPVQSWARNELRSAPEPVGVSARKARSSR